MTTWVKKGTLPEAQETFDLAVGRVVLVTGAGGSIGSELCRQLAGQAPKRLLILDIYENGVFELEQDLKSKYPDLSVTVLIASIRDRERIFRIFENCRPELVFHAAAHKHVHLMEENPSEAIKNNVFGTENVMAAARAFGAEKFVLISTDKAVNPVGVMGATKRFCEMMVQAEQKEEGTVFSAVRFGNVFGSSGSVVPLFKRQIASGGPVTLTHRNATRLFMSVQEAVYLVLQAALLSEGGEIFALEMGKPVKIYDLAKQLILDVGLKPEQDIEIKEIGLRPGERLSETLLLTEEGLRTTKHKRIFITAPPDVAGGFIEKSLSLLQEGIRRGDEESLKNLLLRLSSGTIPETS